MANRKYSAVFLVVTIALAAANHLPVFAQPDPLTNDDTKVMEEVIVVAPRITRETPIDSLGGLIVERDEILDITDLDLSRTADFLELEKRIEDAATRLCNELAARYPHGHPRTLVCIRRAVEDTMAQVDQAVREAFASE